jgi:pimeloyl-ACP methyl ester carboxylesterase
MRAWRQQLPGNGLALCVHRFADDAAEPSGVTVVLLHGILDSGASWDLVCEHLVSAGHAIYAPDMRGFGASDRVPSGGYYHFPDYVADVARLVEAIDAQPLVVVGHSMGGTIASLYTGSRPDRVAALVLLEGVGPPAMPPELTPTRYRKWLDDLDRPPRPAPIASAEEALSRLRRHHAGVDDDVLRSRIPLLTGQRPDGTLVWTHDPLHRTTAPMPFFADAFCAFLQSIVCPVLFVSGGPSGWHPPDERERLDTIRAPLTTHEIPGAGHMMHWTAPAELAAAIERWLAEALALDSKAPVV